MMKVPLATHETCCSDRRVYTAGGRWVVPNVPIAWAVCQSCSSLLSVPLCQCLGQSPIGRLTEEGVLFVARHFPRHYQELTREQREIRLAVGTLVLGPHVCAAFRLAERQETRVKRREPETRTEARLQVARPSASRLLTLVSCLFRQLLRLTTGVPSAPNPRTTDANRGSAGRAA